MNINRDYRLNKSGYQQDRYYITLSGNVYSISKRNDGTGDKRIIISAFNMQWDLPECQLNKTLSGLNTGSVGGVSNGTQLYAFFNTTATQFIGYGLLNTGSDPTLVSPCYKKIVYYDPLPIFNQYHKSYTNATPISDEWVECNGQTLADSDSPFNGLVVPNLNGDPAGANSPNMTTKEQCFLKGGLTSGTGQYHQFQNHFHSDEQSITLDAVAGGSFAKYVPDAWNGGATAYLTIGNPVSNGVDTPLRAGADTHPTNMTVVWIMKVK